MKAMCMGELKKDEFLKGCEVLGCDDISSWQAVVPKLRQQLKNQNQYKQMYNYVFGFACDKGMKSLDVESANAMWDMLIGDKKCRFMAQWKGFLEEKVNKKEINTISKDTWELFYDLVESTGGDFKRFEDDGAWPVLIDQFAEYMSK